MMYPPNYYPNNKEDFDTDAGEDGDDADDNEDKPRNFFHASFAFAIVFFHLFLLDCMAFITTSW